LGFGTVRLMTDSIAVLRRYFNGILAVLFVGFAGVASAQTLPAQTLPAQYSVTGVVADDVLNIRAEPRADAAIVGGLGPYAFNVEVLEIAGGGTWGLVATGEGSGWVSMRFMARQETFAGAIPRPLSCYGAEPFWSIGMYPRGSEYELMGEARQDLTLISENVAQNGYLALLMDAQMQTWTLIVERRGCFDGMSDRRFGFSGMVYSQSAEGGYVHTGCCTLDGN